MLLKVEELRMVREEIQLKLILSARLGLRPRVNILVQTPKSKPNPRLDSSQEETSLVERLF